MKDKIFEGSAVELVTPFTESGKQVNYDKLNRRNSNSRNNRSIINIINKRT